ncbi:gas vesicle protein GvpG [Kribbella pratensis]|uniref:Gas vesicle protein GvpG n=2 Tax=Kribbellaceae TaxID=2726069 RepID=A0ABY2FHX4_9ACTN|nr:gas vesicle protein GvpG [Kribbella pratensis]TDW98611.1 gas vesicle protein GvpG [Kribbella sp. VKM Ac-2566]
MGLMTNLLTLPLAPVRATIALAEQIRQQAEAEYYDPARIRLQLEQIDTLRENGEIDPDVAAAWEDELVSRLYQPREET